MVFIVTKVVSLCKYVSHFITFGGYTVIQFRGFGFPTKSVFCLTIGSRSLVLWEKLSGHEKLGCNLYSESRER